MVLDRKGYSQNTDVLIIGGWWPDMTPVTAGRIWTW